MTHTISALMIFALAIATPVIVIYRNRFRPSTFTVAHGGPEKDTLVIEDAGRTGYVPWPGLDRATYVNQFLDDLQVAVRLKDASLMAPLWEEFRAHYPQDADNVLDSLLEIALLRVAQQMNQT